MKKLILSMAMLLAVGVAASARDVFSRDIKQLPQAAQATLSKNFKGKVTLVKADREFGRTTEYEAVLSDGSEVTFDKKGNWKDVEMQTNSQVPSALIPAPISSYVKANHPRARIVGIEKDRSGYDVQLSDGLEIKFDKQGSFKRYED